MQRVIEERVHARGGEPPVQSVWVIWADTEDGRDRIAGVRKAGLSGVTEISMQPEKNAVLPGVAAPEAVLIIGTPRHVVEIAGAIVLR